MNTIALNLKDLGILLESAAQRGAEIALAKSNETRLVNKTEALELLGIKSHATLRKLAARPGFPRPIRGRFVRSEVEAWLQTGGAK